MEPQFSQWPQYAPDEIAAVIRVLESGRVNYWNGTEGRAFEQEFASYHGTQFGVAVANGTVALELALLARGIGPGDEVIVTPRTFLASVSSIILRGARPVFADVDRDSGNITPATVRPLITQTTRAIMCVHLAGWPCDMPGFRALADEFRLDLIEDCAQAHGATIDSRPVGSFGDAAAFSFCTDKIMSTGGEGGIVLLRDAAAWRRAWSYKDHGKEWDAVYHGDHPPGFRWLHESFGTNWRLTEMQAAIGRVQLGKLQHWLERRRNNAHMLLDGLAKTPGLRLPVPEDGLCHAWYKFYAYVEPDILRSDWNRDRIMREITAQGVPCMQGICPEVYLEKAFADQAPAARDKSHSQGLRPARRLPVARELGETSLMFLVDPSLGESKMKETVRVVKKVMALAV